jgi:hypothetical protein
MTDKLFLLTEAADFQAGKPLSASRKQSIPLLHKRSIAQSCKQSVSDQIHWIIRPWLDLYGKPWAAISSEAH